MKNIVITVPTLNDIRTMVLWGRENRELWADEYGRWYTAKSLQKWIQNPRDDVLLVAKVQKDLVGMCLTRTLTDWAYCESLFIKKE